MPQYENINIFGYLGGRGGGGRSSKIRLGPYWFTSTLSFILIYMSNMEAIWELFELKYKLWTIFFIVFGVIVGPYIKSRGTVGTKMSENADLITLETYVQQGKT